MIRATSAQTLQLVVCARQVVVWATVFGVPVVFLRSTYDPFDAPKLAWLLVGTGLALFTTVPVLSEIGRGATKSLLIPAAAVVLPISLAWVATEHKRWALLGEYSRYQGWLPTITVVVLALLAAKTFEQNPARLAGAVVTAGMSVASYAVIQMLGLDPLEWFESAYVASTVGHSNFSGGFLAMALPLSLGVWISGGRWGGFARIGTILIAVALIGTFSQGAWVAATAGLVMFAGLSLRRRLHPAPTIATAIVSMIALGVVVLVISAQTFLEPRLAGTSIWTRGLHWGTAVSVAADDPLTGAGPNAFSIVASAHRSPAEVLIAGRADDPHSVPLAWLANHGLIGLLGFATLVGWTILKARSVGLDPIAIGFVASVAAYLVQSLVTIDELALRSTFWISLAGIAIVSRSVSGEREPVPERSFRAAIALASMVIAAGIAYVGFEIVLSDQHAARAAAAAGLGSIERAEIELERAADRVAGQPEYRHLVGGRFGRAGVDLGAAGGDLIQAMRDAYDPILEFPSVEWRGSYAYWLSQWSAHEPSVVDEAIGAWERVREVDPDDPRIAIQRSDLLVRSDRGAQAVDELMRFTSLMAEVPPGAPPLPDFWGALAIAHYSTGSFNEALATYRQGAWLQPNACRVLIAAELLADRALVQRSPSRDLQIGLTCDPSPAEILAS